MSLTMKIEVTVPSLAVLDTVLSGVQGGVQYWAKVLQCWVPGRAGLAEDPATDLRLVCDVLELESGERISLQDKWSTALRLMADRYPHKFADMVTGTGDCTTGDVLIQLAAFGELRYG